MTQEQRRYADDITVGDVYPFGEYTVTREEIVEYAQKWDPQWFHTDVDAAESGPFGGVIASGIHTMAICQRLAVAAVFDRWQTICGRELTNVQFRRPVRPGTVLSGRATVASVTPEPARRRTGVVYDIELTDGGGDVVLTVSMDVLLALAP